MRMLKRIGLVLAGFVILLVVVGFFLPSSWRAEQSIEISADGAHILPLIESPKRWLEWAAWTPERYPGMQSTFAGPERGPGARWQWAGEKSGAGVLEITKSDPAAGIEYVLTFEGFSPTPGGLRFEPTAGGTRVVWWMQGDVGNNPLNRYFSLLMEPMMRKDLVAGLEKLKVLAEQAKVEAEKEAEERARAEAEARAAAEAAAAAEAEGAAEEVEKADAE
jgi:hypothetical protein